MKHRGHHGLVFGHEVHDHSRKNMISNYIRITFLIAQHTPLSFSGDIFERDAHFSFG
jgi:hypothetical protein